MGHILGDQVSKGIHTFRFNENGSLTEVGEEIESENPTFLARSPDGKFLYASNEVASLEGSGYISSYSINQESGKLSFINRVSSEGAYSAHLDVNKSGTRVVCGNYKGASTSLFNINEDGSLSEIVSKLTFE